MRKKIINYMLLSLTILLFLAALLKNTIFGIPDYLLLKESGVYISWTILPIIILIYIIALKIKTDALKSLKQKKTLIQKISILIWNKYFFVGYFILYLLYEIYLSSSFLAITEQNIVYKENIVTSNIIYEFEDIESVEMGFTKQENKNNYFFYYKIILPKGNIYDLTQFKSSDVSAVENIKKIHTEIINNNIEIVKNTEYYEKYLQYANYGTDKKIIEEFFNN